MQTYLVGGAIRDRLLNLSPSERDWVVVGATPKELLAQGFKQVGKDFPVFLHPNTKEEYALARTERKTSRGHKGFVIHSSPDITLEEDLLRRDLTINAIAENEQGKLIDPYGGQQDLRNRVLRHVSPAFSEDPLRVLRVARFAAKLAHLQFKIDKDTLELMRTLAHSDELTCLSRERVWQETQRAFVTNDPEVFFQTLRQCDALAKVFPNLSHSLLDETRLNALNKIKKIKGLPARYVALILVASRTPQGYSIALVDTLNKCFASPRELQDFSRISAQHLPECNRALELSNKELHKLLLALDAFRRHDRCKRLLSVMQDVNVILDQENLAVEFLNRALDKLSQVKLEKNEMQNLDGQAIAEKLAQKHCVELSKLSRN